MSVSSSTTTTSSSSRTASGTAAAARFFAGLLGWLCVTARIGLAHNVHANETELVVSSCFDQPDKVLVMNCSSGHMVRVNQVFYGYSPTGSCGHTSGDCFKDVPKEENYPCVGHHTCGINLPSGTLGRVIPSCGEHSTYMQAHYQCVDATEVMDICRVGNVTAETGYVKTPQYPINYQTRTECAMTIRAPHAGQRIRLYAIDFQLETNSTRCPDLFHVHDAYSSHSACGARARDHLFTSHGDWIRLEFVSNHENTYKGFWLYFEAYPLMGPITTTTTSATTTTASAEVTTLNATTTDGSMPGRGPVAPPNTTTSSAGPPPVDSTTHSVNPTVHIVYQLDNPFPLGILVGVLLGALLVVLVILLVILILKRRGSGLSASSSVTSQTAFLGPKNNNLQQAGQVHCINNHLYTGEPGANVKPPLKKEQAAAVAMGKDNAKLENTDVGAAAAAAAGTPHKSGKERDVELELGLNGEKHLPAKAPYIDTNDVGEEMLYC